MGRVLDIRGNWGVRESLDTGNCLELRESSARGCPKVRGAPDIGSFPVVGGTSGAGICTEVDRVLETRVCLEEGKVCGARSFLESEGIPIPRDFPGTKGA